MKKHLSAVALLLLLLIPTLASAQEWTYYEWDAYSTGFKIPADFEVTDSSDEKFSATNSATLISIYPRTEEYLTWDEMSSTLKTWATENAVENIGAVVELDEEKNEWLLGHAHRRHQKRLQRMYYANC